MVVFWWFLCGVGGGILVGGGGFSVGGDGNRVVVAVFFPFPDLDIVWV